MRIDDNVSTVCHYLAVKQVWTAVARRSYRLVLPSLQLLPLTSTWIGHWQLWYLIDAPLLETPQTTFRLGVQEDLIGI